MAKQMEKGRLTLTLESAPFGRDPEGAEPYYTALGKAMILWGRFEAHLDACVLMVCNSEEGKEFRPKSLPISMKQKSKLLPRALRSIKRLAPVKVQLLQLLPDAVDAAEDRHVIAHGAWGGFINEDPLTGRFHRHRRRGNTIEHERFDVSLHQLEDLVAKFDTLNTRLLPITFKLVQLHGPNKGSSV